VSDSRYARSPADSKGRRLAAADGDYRRAQYCVHTLEHSTFRVVRPFRRTSVARLGLVTFERSCASFVKVFDRGYESPARTDVLERGGNRRRARSGCTRGDGRR